MNRLSLVWTGLLLISFCTRLSAVPVTDGLLLWLDATDPTTLFQDSSFSTPADPGDPIGGWMDKSGNDFYAFQDDEFLQPIWDATAMNGQPALRFSGSENDGMSIDDGLFLERPYTVFIVNQYWDVAFRGRTLQGQDANWLTGLWSSEMGAYAEPWIGHRNAPVDTPVVVDTTGNFDESTLTINGVDFTDDSTPVGSPGRLGLVSVGQFPLEVSDADISEVVIYDRVLSEAEMNDVRGYLYAKYDVSLFELTEPNQVFKGSLGVFTGGDPDDGLDLEGAFAYAINVGGPGNLVVGDAEFTDGSQLGMQGGSSPGATINEANEANPWTYVANFGDTTNDNNLETVMDSIRWNAFSTQPPLNVDLEVEEGMPYRLQLLFAEGIWDRGFDIRVEDELAVGGFAIHVAQEGYYPDNEDRAVVYTLDLVAPDDMLNISLGGYILNNADNNPLLQALTLELLPGNPVTGDYNNDGQLDVGDLNLQAVAIAGGQDPPEYDLNNDGLVNFADRKQWVEVLKETWIGDANLDGEFNSSDMVEVFAQGKYETGEDAAWNEGDWDGNLKFDSSDMVAAFAGGGYEKGKRPEAAVSAVPEPSSAAIVPRRSGSMGRLFSSHQAAMTDADRGVCVHRADFASVGG